MSNDLPVPAADLADALDNFANRTAVPGAERDVHLMVGGPHAPQQRTVRLPGNAAAWLTEVVRAELDALRAVEGDDQGDRNDGEARPPGPGPAETWFG
ncbi:hypothetical protein [Kitasatospora herbaricolor]|uniref:Uncharacterized protein n=1 Tax=Kitasatospora herbaricolor TaxID=68217 RepID=A0ABZ1W283_9ACTN|nr:hypothetical protein [Kitasatospora herbaricolor]